MKKSRTQKAVDALMRVVTWHKLHPDGHPKEWPEPRPLTVYRAAKRYGLDPSGVLRAFKRRLRQRRCPVCRQVIR
jgi:hypothetical protein